MNAAGMADVMEKQDVSASRAHIRLEQDTNAMLGRAYFDSLLC